MAEMTAEKVDDPELVAIWNEMARAIQMQARPQGRVHHRRPFSPYYFRPARVLDSGPDNDEQERCLLENGQRAGDFPSIRQKANRFVQCVEKYLAACRLHLKLMGRKMRAGAKNIRVRQLQNFTGWKRRAKSKKREDEKSSGTLHCLGRLTWANLRILLEDIIKFEDEIVSSVDVPRSILYFA